MSSTDLKRLRKLIDVERSVAGRVPSTVRAEVMVAIERAHAEGASYSSLADALGLTSQTVSRWRLKRPDAKLVAVRVPLPAAGLVMHASHGVRIEGLSLDDVVELLKRLA